MKWWRKRFLLKKEVDGWRGGREQAETERRPASSHLSLSLCHSLVSSHCQHSSSVTLFSEMSVCFVAGSSCFHPPSLCPSPRSLHLSLNPVSSLFLSSHPFPTSHCLFDSFVNQKWFWRRGSTWNLRWHSDRSEYIKFYPNTWTDKPAKLTFLQSVQQKHNFMNSY